LELTETGEKENRFSLESSFFFFLALHPIIFLALKNKFLGNLLAASFYARAKKRERLKTFSHCEVTGIARICNKIFLFELADFLAKLAKQLNPLQN